MKLEEMTSKQGRCRVDNINSEKDISQINKNRITYLINNRGLKTKKLDLFKRRLKEWNIIEDEEMEETEPTNVNREIGR